MDNLLKQLESFTSIPARGEKQFDIYLEEKISEYYRIIEASPTPLDRDDFEQMRDLGKRCLDAVRYAMRGLPHRAYLSLWDNLRMTLYTKTFKAGRPLYRMRKVENKNNLNVGDLFHVPFTMQGKVTTQRYSVPGLPCLYLGLSLYGCWEELRRPLVQDCVFSKCKSEQSFSILDFRVPKQEASEGERKNFLRIMPLVIASSINMQDEDDVFKPEYIVPQLVVQGIPDLNRIKTSDLETVIIGVGYRSVHQNSEFGFPDSNFDNIVIPAQRTTGYKYDQRLCDMFRLTQPTCEEYERIRSGSTFNVNNHRVINTDLSPEQNYGTSLFGQLEARINNDKLFPLKKVVNESVR